MRETRPQVEGSFGSRAQRGPRFRSRTSRISREIQVCEWIPFVMDVIGTSLTGTPAHCEAHIFRLTSPWSRLTPFTVSAILSANTAMLKRAFESPGRSRPRSMNSCTPRPHALRHSPKICSMSPVSNRSIAALTAVWVVKIVEALTHHLVFERPDQLEDPAIVDELAEIVVRYVGKDAAR